MALCDTCNWYDKEYDEFRERYDDRIKDGGDQREKHHCPAYDNIIPPKIWYENGNCPYYVRKD